MLNSKRVEEVGGCRKPGPIKALWKNSHTNNDDGSNEIKKK